MREIIPGLLWVGNAFDARDLKGIFDQRIQAIIDLAREESPASTARELVYCRFPLVDGQGNSPAIIEAAISTGVRFVTAKVPTLISCGGGMSRSPAIAAAVLAQAGGIKPEDAMKRVAATGPHDVAPLCWHEVVDVLRGLRTTGTEAMTEPELRLVVIRTMDVERLAAFYGSFGIKFTEEQHGSGPRHFAAQLSDVVVEIYAANAPDDVDRTTRLGFSVSDVHSAIKVLEAVGAEIVVQPKQTQWGLRAVAKDPDGRAVELYAS